MTTKETLLHSFTNFNNGGIAIDLVRITSDKSAPQYALELGLSNVGMSSKFSIPVTRSMGPMFSEIHALITEHVFDPTHLSPLRTVVDMKDAREPSGKVELYYGPAGLERRDTLYGSSCECIDCENKAEDTPVPPAQQSTSGGRTASQTTVEDGFKPTQEEFEKIRAAFTQADPLGCWGIQPMVKDSLVSTEDLIRDNCIAVEFDTKRNQFKAVIAGVPIGTTERTADVCTYDADLAAAVQEAVRQVKAYQEADVLDECAMADKLIADYGLKVAPFEDMGTTMYLVTGTIMGDANCSRGFNAEGSNRYMVVLDVATQMQTFMDGLRVSKDDSEGGNE